MKKIKKIGRVARWWHVVVGVRWQRFQGRWCGLYFQRVTLPVRFWRACGCPAQWRPRLPWWQPFLWRWLVLSGAYGPIHPLAHHPLRRPSRRQGAMPNGNSLGGTRPSQTLPHHASRLPMPVRNQTPPNSDTTTMQWLLVSGASRASRSSLRGAVTSRKG
jgi:hypothetical protein